MPTEIQQVAYGAENLPLRVGAHEIPCFILKNGQQVFNLADIQKVLAYDGKAEDWLIDLLASINKFLPVSGELFNVLEKPILFELKKRGHEPTTANGIPARLFPGICTTIVEAKNNGYLNISQLKFAKAAENILKKINGLDLEHAVNEASGFLFYKTRAKEKTSHWMQNATGDTLFQWIPTFPDAFFENFLESEGYTWKDLIERTPLMAKLIHETVFLRLPEPALAELRATKPKRQYHSKNGNPQDTQHPILKTLVAEITALLKMAGNNSTIFAQLHNNAFPIQKNWLAEQVFSEDHSGFEEQATLLEQNLIKALAFKKIYKKQK